MPHNGWNKEYYDTIEFFYWEPQHIGKIQNPKARYNNIESALAHIKKMEVSLNHQFSIFFKLVPNGLVNRLITFVFNENVNDTFTLMGRDDIREFISEHFTQPDIFFKGKEHNLSFEMKINSKSNLEQVIKYVILHHIEEKISGISKSSIIVFLGKPGIQNLWREKFLNVEELKKATLAFDLSSFMNKSKVTRALELEEVKTSLNKARIQFCSYNQFHAFLAQYKNSINQKEKSAETLNKLISGLQNELELRQLV